MVHPSWLKTLSALSAFLGADANETVDNTKAESSYSEWVPYGFIQQLA